MKKNIFILLLFAFTLINCSNDEQIGSSDSSNPTNSAESIEVFLGQTHILQPEDPLFGLVSERDALIKVQVISENGGQAPIVNAILSLNGTTQTLQLEGPSELPTSFEINPGKVQHTFDDSFTATITKDWIKPGLSIRIEAGDENKQIDNLKIGAPNKIIMTMFDTHFFQYSVGDYPTGWKEELEAKWPSSGIELIRVPNVVFSELTVPPRGGNIIAARVSSKEEYKDITGYNFDGEQATASQWNRALKEAAGKKGRYSLFYTNIYGVFSGGQAGGFAGVGNGKKIGLLHHELGHAFSLPHWGNNNEYPYKGDMHGIEAPDIHNKTHAGPTWAYDPVKKYLIPPTIQENTIGWKGEVGQYKIDPMQGGGTGSQEQQYLLNHFSDYSVNKMRNYLQNHIVIWNEQSGNYASWDSNTGGYNNILDNNGVNFAKERNVEVLSVMAGVSSLTPQANIIYPPIGPYQSGLIDLFNPEIEEDRLKADEIYCPNGGCDVSLRIVQGGITKLYMLPLEMDTSVEPSNARSYKTKALNLRASEGTVTKIELLSTPDVEKNGLPDSPIVLYTWNN
ncbi:M66 family metalloprotease [Aquimarina sp. 2201CG14-23]|uniref:M66 family metalloprotease n=1 Tax=Aquimarina mycalae TaxID=3040073 RepID=UPI0024782D51|nr:M66 family metalloprotease [Aquimarina sp. 2201CG14-23]MDH7445929.1 M66 family metalloprotease [Aquimarina sp. 2201CG14-23]